MKKVSFIIPCYNAQEWIAEAIESCLEQRNINSEIIVIDDGSSDRSLDIIKSFGENVLCESGPNRGVNPSRNRGLELASGDYVRFLDADDKLEKDTTYLQVTAMEEKDAELCYGDWCYIYSDVSEGPIKGPVKKSGYQAQISHSLLCRWWCPPFVYLYKRSFLEKNSLYWNIHLGFPDDFEYILRVTLKGAKYVYLPYIIGYYRQHPGSRLSGIPKLSWIRNSMQILEYAETELVKTGQMDKDFSRAICQYYFWLAQNCVSEDRSVFLELIRRIDMLGNDYQHPKKLYHFLVNLMGLEKVESILNVKRKIRKYLSFSQTSD